MLEWESILRNVRRLGTVRHIELRKIPQLKTCNNWQAVEFLGRVRHTLPHAVYDGGLVLLDDRIYYINAKQIEVVSHFARFRNLGRIISVVP